MSNHELLGALEPKTAANDEYYDYEDYKIDAAKIVEKYRCDCINYHLTKHKCKDGRYQYKNQCLNCYSTVGSQIAKRLCGNTDCLPEYDKESREKVLKNQHCEYEKIQQKLNKSKEKSLNEYEHDREQFLEKYIEYLKTDSWKQKRLRVLERSNGFCEGCLVKKATQVHHKTYRNVGDEFLFQLVAICNDCHEKFHDEKETYKLKGFNYV